MFSLKSDKMTQQSRISSVPNKTEVENVQLGNTYIADMDEYPQDKCCLDICRGDSCNLLYMFPGPFVKFYPNRASNSWDIADMDKCPQDKCCLDKCRGDCSNRLYMFPGPFV